MATQEDNYETMDPMQDLADAFNSNIPVDKDAEIRQLKEANKKLQTTLNKTQRSLDELTKHVTLTCDKVLSIMRDGEHYHRTEDYTESKK